MSLLGLVANIRIAGGPDRCIRICTQFLVASQSQIIIGEFYSLMMASGVHVLVFLTVRFLPGISVKKINTCTPRASQHWDGWQIRANGGCLD